MTVSIVATSSATANPATITSTTAGSTLVVWIGMWNGSSPSITSVTATGATFTQVPGVYTTDTSHSGDMWIAQSVSSGVTSITVTMATGSYDQLICYELSSCVLDTASTGVTGGTTNPSTPSVTNADASSILIAGIETNAGFSAVSAPWTQAGGFPNGNGSAYYIPGSATTSSPSWTGSGSWVAVGASFKTPGASSVVENDENPPLLLGALPTIPTVSVW